MFEKWQEQMDKGHQAFTMRDFATAEQHFQAAVQLAEKFGHNNLSLAQSLEKAGEAILGQAPLENDRVEVCYENYERACSIYEAAHGPIHTKVAECLSVMAKLLFWFSSEEAEKLARRAVSIFEELNSDLIAEPMEILISAASLTERKEERDEMLQSLVDRFEKRADIAPIPLAKSLVSLARRADSNDIAIPHFKRALDLLSNSTETALIVDVHVALGKIQFQEEDFAAAEEAFKTAFQLGECAPNVPGQHLEEALCRLARIQYYLYEDFEEAERLLKQAEGMREPNGGVPLGSGVETERLYLSRVRNDFAAQETEHRALLNAARERFQNEQSEWKDLHQMSCVMQALSLAAAVYRLGNKKEACQLWEEVIRDGYPGSWTHTKAIFRLALCQAENGHSDEATKLLDQGLKQIIEDTAADNIALAILALNLLGETDKIPPLIDNLMQQLQKAKEDPKDEYGTVSITLASLAYAHAGIGKRDKALEFIEESIAREKKENSLFAALAYEEWSATFELEGWTYLSKPLQERAKTIRKNILKMVRQSADNTLRC